MALFCYTSSGGRTIERVFRMGKAPKTVSVGGTRYLRDVPAEWNGRRDQAGNWPQKSDALGVLDSQTDEAAQHLADNGVSTAFTSDGTGRCIVESRGHRNRIMKVLGIHDRDAGYGDRTRP